MLIVDTMINRQLLCQLHDLVRVETDLPVRHAVNTSDHGDHGDHGDHRYGNAFLPDEVQVVQHERIAAYIGEHVDEDVVFMETNFGADPGIDEVGLVVPDVAVGDEGWRVDLGGRVVEAQYWGFAQTDGDLFGYLPDAAVLFTGNPVVAAAPAIPWLLDGHAHDVGATLAAMQASLPADAVAAARGLGVGFLPVFHTCDLERTGALVSLLPGWGDEVPLHLLFPTRQHLPLRVRVLMDFLAERLSAASG